MGLLSQAVGRIAPSTTVALSARARGLREAGRDVIELVAGEPDFDTPAHVREAAKAALDRGETRYTAPDGTPALKAAIIAKHARENGLRFRPEQVIVTPGGKMALFEALLATLDAGDEVVISAPYWVSYPEIVRFAGGVPRIVATRAEDGFRLRPEALAAALGPRTKWLVLNSPGNPTGAGYAATDLAALGAVLADRPQAHVLSDEIYEPISFPPFRFASFAAACPALADRTLTVNGVSKSHAMTGWRIGWAAGPSALIAAMRTVQTQSATCASAVSQAAAVAALEGPQDFLETSRATFRRRRDRVVAALNAAGLDCPTPEGAFYAFFSVARVLGRRTPRGRGIADDPGFCEALLEEAGVALAPGAAFGASPFARLSYAAADPVLEDALARIAAFCASLR